jgi:LPXTG-motif cell wall-anchored protein
MKKRLLIGVGAGVVAASLLATPAFAASYTGGVITSGNMAFQGFDYDAFNVGDSEASTAWSTANPQQSGEDPEGLNRNWDGRGYGSILPVEPGDAVYYSGLDSSDADVVCELTDVAGDSVIVCPTEVVEGITMYPHVTIYGDQMLTRVVWVLTNNTSAAIDRDFATEIYSECDENGFMETSAGDEGSDATGWDMTASTWSVQRGTPYDDDGWYQEICGIETAAWQLSGAPVVASENTLDSTLDGQDITFPVVLAPGETMAFAFYFYDAWASDGNVDTDDSIELPTPYTANRQAAFEASVTYAGATFGTFSDVLKRNLPEGVWIANWEPKSLPDTGASATQLWGFGALAAGLLAAGAALVWRARRSN